MSTDDEDLDLTTLADSETIAGSGTLEYSIVHRREKTATALKRELQKAVEVVNARYFNQAPDRRPGAKRADTEYELRAIRAAIDAANDSSTFGENIAGDLTYVIEEGYYPGEWTHYIGLTDIPVSSRARALLAAQSALCRRGYMVNSARSDDDGLLEKLHVVSMRWAYDARSSEVGEGDHAE